MLGLVLATACTASEVDPDARIDIGGTVRRQNGDGAKAVRVGLSREADLGEVFAVFTTFGLACIDAHTTVCLGSRVTRTDDAGSFDYELRGKDTQGIVGQASTMVLTSQLGPRPTEAVGPIATYRFQVQTEKLNLPVAFWEPSLDGSTGSFGARVTWTAVPGRVLPPGLGSAAPEYALEFRRGNENVWRVDPARSGFAFDARLLEDASGTGSVVAALDGEKVSDEHGRSIDVVLRSGSRYFEGPAGAPPSRGTGCSVPDERGRPVVQSPCLLTDGSFEDGFTPSVCRGETGCVEPSARSTTIDLRTVRALTLVAVRGCSARCMVETSKNARTWRTAGVADSENAALILRPAVSARYLRVSSSVSVAGLREVSAWTGSGAVAAGPLFVKPGAASSPLPVPGSTGSPRAVVPLDKDEGLGWLVVVAAGVLGIVGGVLAGVTLSRRRRPRSP